MKSMKLVIFLISFLLFENLLKASNIKCVYTITDNLDYVVTYDNVNHEFKKEYDRGNNNNPYIGGTIINSDLSARNFEKNDCSLTCLEELYLVSQTPGEGGRSMIYNLSFDKKRGQIINGDYSNVRKYTLNKEKSVINNDEESNKKDCSSKNVEGNDKFIECKYVDNAGGNFSVKVYYNKETGEITNLGEGQCVSAETTFRKEDFENLNCPNGSVWVMNASICRVIKYDGEYNAPEERPNADVITEENNEYTGKFKMPEIGFGSEAKDCHDLVGEAVSKIIKSIFNILRIAGVIIAIVNAMITLIPAVVSKNADALKKAANKCVIMAIVLASIGILPSIIRLISLIFGYDVSCMF